MIEKASADITTNWVTDWNAVSAPRGRCPRRCGVEGPNTTGRRLSVRGTDGHQNCGHFAVPKSSGEVDGHESVCMVIVSAVIDGTSLTNLVDRWIQA